MRGDQVPGDEGTQADMSGRGPRLIRERYTWELESRQLVDLYAGLLPLAPA